MNQMSRITAAPVDFKARFTTAEFLRMVECDAFEDWKIELVDGELERMPPPGNDHSRLQIVVIARLLKVAPEALVRGETGIVFANNTVLGCDGALLRAPVIGRRLLRPDEVHLVVEVAETTLSRDKDMKRRKYAEAAIPEYWVISDKDTLVHVFRHPLDGDYTEVREVPFDQPLTVPGSDATITFH